MVKERMSLLYSLQLMYSYFNELTLYAGVLYMQPSSYSLSSWPHGDITSLGRSVTCTFLASPFFTAEMFLGQYILQCSYAITETYYVCIYDFCVLFFI